MDVGSPAPYRLLPLVHDGALQPPPPVLVAHPRDISQLCRQLDEEERRRTLTASDALLMLCCTPAGPSGGGGEPRLLGRLAGKRPASSRKGRRQQQAQGGLRMRGSDGRWYCKPSTPNTAEGQAAALPSGTWHLGCFGSVTHINVLQCSAAAGAVPPLPAATAPGAVPVRSQAEVRA